MENRIEEVKLAKKALALLLLVKPRIGESVYDFVSRAEKEVAQMVEKRAVDVSN